MMKTVQWNQAATGSRLTPLGNGSTAGAQLVFAVGRLDTPQWLCCIGLGEWKSLCLIPHLTSHPCWDGHLVSLLGNDRSGWGQRLLDTHKMGHLNQLIKILYRDCPLKSIYTGSKYIYTLFPLRELQPHTSSSDLLVTNLPIMFFPSSWPYSQTVNHISGISGHPYLRLPLLSGKANNLVHCGTCCSPEASLPCFAGLSWSGAIVLSVSRRY